MIKIEKIWLTDSAVWIRTNDGKEACETFADYPRLRYATPEQREQYEADEFGIHWESLDEDLSFEGFFDKKEPTYQEFPKGIYLEQFDEALTVQASLKADYAYYNEPDQHWTLRGNVHAMNRKGEHFDTQELKWDQKTHRVYSDSAIHITREKSIIEGVGFESNEEMSKYTIMHPTGVFPIDDEEEAQPAEESKLKIANI